MEWYNENDKHLGFIDGTYLYRVAFEDGSWYWEFIPGMEGMDGYDTAEEAKAAAEADAEAYDFYEEEEESLLDVLDDEGEWDAYWDAIAHERMENEKGLL